MPSASAIRAGEAFVELYVKNNVFTRALKAAGDKLRNFGKFADGLVAKSAGLAGLVATPVLGAVKEFADLGRELVHSSERIGATVEDLDAMRYAAEQAGLGAEELEGATARLNRVAAAAPDKLERLGVSAKEFAGLSLEEKFQAVAQGVADLKDDTQKTAAVMDIFGRAGARLLPLFKDGAGGIAAATAEARRLGLVMSGDDARKAAELAKAFDKLKAVVRRTFLQLGAALLPVFEKIRAAIDEKIGNLQAAGRLIRNNAGLITSFLQIAKTVLKVAAAWAAFRVAVTQVGNAFAIANSLWGAAASVLAFLLSPIGLITAAVIGLSALILNFATDGRVFTDLGEQFAGLAGRFDQAWGGIKDALREGDLGLAARIAWLGVQREVLGVWKALRLAWTDTVNFFGDGWDSFIYLLEGGWNQFGDFFEDVGKDMAFAFMTAFLEVVRVIQDNTRELRGWLERRGLATFKDVDVDGLKKAVGGARKDLDRQDQEARDKRDRALDAEFQKNKDRREQERADLEKDLDAAIADADRKVGDAIGEATKKRLARAAGEAFAAVWKALHPDTVGGAAPVTQGVLAASAAGTFTGFAAGQQLGLGKDIGKQQLDTLKDIDEKLGEIKDNGGLAIGQ